MEEQIFFTNSQGLRLAGILSRPMRRHKLPIVVTCHGFGSGKDSETNTLLVQRLNQLGIASLRFDFSGHSDSEGDIARVTVSQGVDDLRSALRSLEGYSWTSGSIVGLFGQSYGGNVVLWYAADHDRARAIALQAPVSDYVAVKERKLGPEGMLQWKTNGYALEDTDGDDVRLNYTFYEDARSRNTYELAKQISIDCLILHGDKDNTVPLQQSQALARVLGQRVRLQVIPNATHTFGGPGEMESVVSETARFFQVHLQVTPQSDSSEGDK